LLCVIKKPRRRWAAVSDKMINNQIISYDKVNGYLHRTQRSNSQKKNYRPNLGSRITQKVSLVVLIDFLLKLKNWSIILIYFYRPIPEEISGNQTLYSIYKRTHINVLSTYFTVSGRTIKFAN
jgi:hypothetical protein